MRKIVDDRGRDVAGCRYAKLTDYVCDTFGVLFKVDSKQGKDTDRSIKYSYDKLDRVIRVDYTKHWSENRNR